MTPLQSAYAALGLDPGASRAQVDDAYRRLIKRHHPDRAGGDPSRAAEVNRAYTLLRRERLAAGPQARPVPVVLHPKLRPRSRRSDWLFTAVLLAIIVGGIAAMQLRGDAGVLARPIDIRWPSGDTSFEPRDQPLVTFDEPLSLPVIDSAIDQAEGFHSAKNLAGAESYSRDCQARLRRELNVVWFDACAAFDEAVIALSSERDLDDSQIFNESAVVSREMAAARALSDDILGADSRLHQIRSRVDLRLLPRFDPAATQKP